jgi:hypothetical protein
MKMFCLAICMSLLIFSCSSPKSRSLDKSFNSDEDRSHLFKIYKNRKFGFMDRNGKVVINPQYDYVEDFSEGFALAGFVGKKRFFIDRTGKTAIAPKYFDAINGFNCGLARGNTNHNVPNGGYIDKSGKLVIENFYGVCLFSEGLACVELNKWGFIDTSGQFVIKPHFDEVAPFSEGLAGVTFWDQSKASRNKRGFIDKTGKIVIKSEFDVTHSFSEGFAAVGMEASNHDYKWGYIDKTGTMVIKPQFEWANSFRQGLAAVLVSNRWGYINKNGNIIIKCQFDKAEAFSEGLAAVAINSKWGYIDKTGTYIVKPQFNEAMPFHKGIAFVKIGGYDANEIVDVIGGFDSDGKWGYIDKNGRYVWQPTN